MQNKPVHVDIEKYGYFLQYSPSEDNWYASTEDDNESTVWYRWFGGEFWLIGIKDVPSDLVIFSNSTTVKEYAMSVRVVNFWYWFVKWLVPDKIKYFCFMHIMAYATTGKYSSTVVPELTGMEAVKRYWDDKKV